MTISTIADAINAPLGTVLPGIRGIVKNVCDRYPLTGMEKTTMSDGSIREWSIQDIVIEDKTGLIVVKVANKDPIPATQQGQHIYLLAHQKSRGGLSGLKVDEEDGIRVLRLTASGELVWGQLADTISAPIEQPISTPAAASPAAPCVAGVASTSVPGPVAGTEPAGGRSAVLGSAPAPSPAIEQACQLYESILKRVLTIQVSDNSGAVIDPQAATDTIFRALISRTS